MRNIHASRAIHSLLLLGLFALPERSIAQNKSSRSSTSIQDGLLDLNTAEASQLQQLPGMGANYAKRILEGRPYSAKNQLVARGVLPQAAYERIKDDVVAHRAKSTADERSSLPK